MAAFVLGWVCMNLHQDYDILMGGWISVQCYNSMYVCGIILLVYLFVCLLGEGENVRPSESIQER